MKEKVQDHLYYVQKILKLEKINGKMYGVVKWENYKEITREPIQSLKLNPHLAEDLEKMEFEFEIQHQVKDIALQVEQYTKSYLKQLYKPINVENSQAASSAVVNKAAVNAIVKPDNERQIELAVNKSQSKRKQQLSLHQLVICNIRAKNRVKQLVKYGLANYRPQHYFQLSEMLYDVSQLLNQDKTVRKTDLVVQQVKGFYIEEHSYKFCLSVAGRVIVVPMVQMMRKFPQNLFNFLARFLRYSRQVMGEQIKKEEEILSNKRYKNKATQSVSKMLNIRQHIESSKRKVYFGRHDEDVQLNIKIQNQRFLGIVDGEDRNKASKEKKAKKDDQSNNFAKDLKIVYEEIESSISKALNIDRSSKQDMKSQSAISKNTHKKSRSQLISQKAPNSEHKSAASNNNNDQVDSFHSASQSATRKRSTKKKARGKQVPDELQPRRSKRISNKSATVRSASRNEDNPSDESELSSEHGSSTGKKRKNSGGKNSTARSGKKKIFKKN